jgi:hypothetical protein
VRIYSSAILLLLQLRSAHLFQCHFPPVAAAQCAFIPVPFCSYCSCAVCIYSSAILLLLQLRSAHLFQCHFAPVAAAQYAFIPVSNILVVGHVHASLGNAVKRLDVQTAE